MADEVTLLDRLGRFVDRVVVGWNRAPLLDAYHAEDCPKGGKHEVDEWLAPDPMSMSGVLSGFACVKCGKETP